MVRRKRGNEQLLAFIKEKHAGESGIVYTSSRAKAETICAFLAAEGINCLCYHAGLSREQRELSQTRFLHEKDAVIVATIAFGMGIDKADVRFVAHTFRLKASRITSRKSEGPGETVKRQKHGFVLAEAMRSFRRNALQKVTPRIGIRTSPR